EVAVQSYRRNAGILEDKGSTITAQQLEDINGRLVQARNARLEAEAHLSTARSLVERGGNIEAVKDGMSSEAIKKLRAKEAEVRQKQAEISSRYTDLYPSAKDLQTDLATLQQQIGDEIHRIVTNLASQVDTAKEREASLERELARLEN